MTDDERSIQLFGRLFLTGQITLVSGLHIGGGKASLSIGSLDNPVVRDALTEAPYIPGSSLRGKLRSLLEKCHGCPQNQSIGEGVYIHVCRKPKKDEREADEDYSQRIRDAHKRYQACTVCPLFGVPGEDAFEPTRLIVRDVPLDEESAKELLAARTDLPYTEVKWEAAIDRVTSAASPRQMERVPAGAVFGPMEMVYNIYGSEDIGRFANLVEAMRLLEDDYLGGLGSRGSGKVAFQNLKLSVRQREHYGRGETRDGFDSVQDLLNKQEEVLGWLRDNLPIS